jgi:hypothetical protein
MGRVAHDLFLPRAGFGFDLVFGFDLGFDLGFDGDFSPLAPVIMASRRFCIFFGDTSSVRVWIIHT